MLCIYIFTITYTYISIALASGYHSAGSHGIFHHLATRYDITGMRMMLMMKMMKMMMMMMISHPFSPCPVDPSFHDLSGCESQVASLWRLAKCSHCCSVQRLPRVCKFCWIHDLVFSEMRSTCKALKRLVSKFGNLVFQKSLHLMTLPNGQRNQMLFKISHSFPYDTLPEANLATENNVEKESSLPTTTFWEM